MEGRREAREREREREHARECGDIQGRSAGGSGIHGRPDHSQFDLTHHQPTHPAVAEC